MKEHKGETSIPGKLFKISLKKYLLIKKNMILKIVFWSRKSNFSKNYNNNEGL